MTLGKCIRRTRLRLDWTARELARRLGIHHVYLSMIETGVRTPSRALMQRAAVLFAEHGEPLPVDADTLLEQRRGLERTAAAG